MPHTRFGCAFLAILFTSKMQLLAKTALVWLMLINQNQLEVHLLGTVHAPPQPVYFLLICQQFGFETSDVRVEISVQTPPHYVYLVYHNI